MKEIVSSSESLSGKGLMLPDGRINLTFNPSSYPEFYHEFRGQRPPSTFTDFRTLTETISLKQEQGIKVILAFAGKDVAETIVPSVENALKAQKTGIIDDIFVIAPSKDDPTYKPTAEMGIPFVSEQEELQKLREPLKYFGIDDATALRGKGVAEWLATIKSGNPGTALFYVDGDIVWTPEQVAATPMPLIIDPGAGFVLPSYTRYTKQGDKEAPSKSGERITRLVALPLISAISPRLSQFLGVLGGFYGGFDLEHMEFESGYGVETSLGLQMAEREEKLGREIMRQFYCGRRYQMGQATNALPKMSREIFDAIQFFRYQRGKSLPPINSPLQILEINEEMQEGQEIPILEFKNHTISSIHLPKPIDVRRMQQHLQSSRR